MYSYIYENNHVQKITRGKLLKSQSYAPKGIGTLFYKLNCHFQNENFGSMLEICI